MLMPTYNRFPVTLVSGKGATATDENGRTYIDFGSGIGVNSLGYADEGWAAAVAAQAAALQHTSNLYHNAVQEAFADELCAAAGMAAAFLCNSGAEANECAIKLARKYSLDTYGAGRHVIVTLNDSFHGRTVTTLAATGQDDFHQYFYPFTGGFVHVPAGDMDALAAAVEGAAKDEKVCAVLFEVVQGEGGVNALDFGYLQAVQAYCRAKDILLIADEIQTGASRTGTFLACEQAGLAPDAVTMAKGIGGGLPIGACLCNEKLAGVLTAGTHGSTFGGNPVCCAAGRYTVARLTSPALLNEVWRKGEILKTRLLACPNVAGVSGLGMMLGVELKRGQARDMAEKCLTKGLLVLTAKSRVRLLPPLTISDGELEQGLRILEEVLR